MSAADMRIGVVALVIVLLSLGAISCGSSSQGSSGAAVQSGSSLKGDGDDDDLGPEPEADDVAFRDYGNAASSGEEQTVTALVKRYYAAAAAGDGVMACSLMLPSLAKEANLGEAAEVAYDPPPSAPILIGKSCVEVMSLVFKEDHPQLTADRSTLAVTGVRVMGNHGFVLLGFAETPESQIQVQREGGIWKIDGLLQSKLP